MSDVNTTRRTVLRSSGAVVIAGLLAGCTSDSTSESTSGGSPTSDGEETTPANTTTSESSTDLDSFLSNVDNYGGIVDETGTDEVTIRVGTEGNGAYYAFEPPAVRVTTGTTVTWEWTGKGSGHNVVAESGGDFESTLTDDAGFTFEQTFDETGTVLYKCNPHAGLGMKGAIIVE